MAEPIVSAPGGDRHPGQNLIIALRRGLDILDMFSAERRVVGITDIAHELDIHKSSASRLAATLASWPPRPATMRSVASREDLTAVVTPFLKDLVESTGETAPASRAPRAAVT